MKKKTESNFPVLLEGFFTQRLMKQQLASAHTIASYRDTFCLLLRFAQGYLKKEPSDLELSDVDATLVLAFLDWMGHDREVGSRTRNVRLTAIRAFFRYAALEAPAHSAQIQRVLSIPIQRQPRPLVTYLIKEEIEALLNAPDKGTWLGRRDHVFLLVCVQTGLRVSEMTSLRVRDLALDSGAHLRVVGKGRKERVVPLTKQAVSALKTWLRETAPESPVAPLFPTLRGQHLSADAVQYMLKKHVSAASKACPSLEKKRVTPHSLRHTLAMALLQSGVDRAVIALWLGHESVETTQMYLHADLVMKEKMLSKSEVLNGKSGRYRPSDRLLSFLRSL